MTPGERLEAVFKKLQQSVLNDEGFGGPVWHDAHIDGWRLVMTQGDLEEVVFSAQKGDQIFGLELRDTNVWVLSFRGTKAEDLEWLVELAERAEWQDLLDRKS